MGWPLQCLASLWVCVDSMIACASSSLCAVESQGIQERTTVQIERAERMVSHKPWQREQQRDVAHPLSNWPLLSCFFEKEKRIWCKGSSERWCLFFFYFRLARFNASLTTLSDPSTVSCLNLTISTGINLHAPSLCPHMLTIPSLFPRSRVCISQGKVRYFEGAPIPTSCALVAGLWWLYRTGRAGWITWRYLPAAGLTFHPLSILYFVQGCLMISTMQIPKL